MSLAQKADRHDLYQQSVQDPEAEMDFVEITFRELRGRPARDLREDFCGTAYSSCEWVARHPEHSAVAVDLDEEVLEWGEDNNLSNLDDHARDRITLLREDVRRRRRERFDCVLAMNFSYYLFEDRDSMREYFVSVRRSLRGDGLFFLDAYGGYDAHRDIVEEREVDGFTYIWEQANFDPISHRMDCYIHFSFPDGSRQDKAFVYPWRLWTLPEIRELLREAGFKRTRIYWEGLDESTGEGNGEFTLSETGSADAGWICYIVAEP